MRIEQIGTRYCVINNLGLIVKTFPTLAAAEKFLQEEFIY